MNEEIMRSRIDPEYRAFYDASPGYDLEHLEIFRVLDGVQEKILCRQDADVSVREMIIPGPADCPELKVRIYEPRVRDGSRLPALLFFHASGFMFGSAMRHEGLCIRYCKHVGCVVVSVEYRLAPEWKAPAAVEDAYAALQWLAREDNGLRVDPTHIAVGGISAGGNLAAAVSLMARDLGGPKIVLQIILAGALDHTMSTYSAKNITSDKVWSYGYSQKAWASYLDTDKEVTCYISPSMAQDLSNLPPCFSYVGGLDPFLDENMQYWSRLMQAGVAVEGHVIPGMYHCFDVSVPSAKRSRSLFELTYDALRRAFDKTV